MSNTINWGKIYEKTAWGIGVVTNTISWGKIYANLAGLIPSFALNFANIVNDFTFTRSSFATRVNEFGLIETVTDLGSDLVRNGDFEELGSELVTNGDFSNGVNGWNNNESFPADYFSVVDNKLEIENISGGTQVFTSDSFNVSANKIYKISLDTVKESGIDDFDITLRNSPLSTVIETITSTHQTGELIHYFKSASTQSLIFQFTLRDTIKGSIDNVSVKQVDPNDEWSLTNGATISNGQLNIDYNLGSGSTTQTNVFTIGKTYKIEINVDNSSVGVVRINNGVSATVLSNGLNTFYLEAVGTAIEIRNHVDFIGSIDNISVQEVLEDDVPRIDYTGSTFDVPVLGNELVINGSFDADSDWTLEGGSYISGGNLILPNTGGALQTVQLINKMIRFDVQGSGTIGYRVNTGVSYQQISLPQTIYLTTGSSGGRVQFSNTSGNEVTIDNVSVKEVTAYTTTDKGSFLLEPQSTNLITYSEDFTQWSAIMNPTVTLNQAISPDGTNNATLLEFDQTVTTSRIEVSIPTTGATDLVFSVWAKSVSGNDVSFGMEIGSAGGLEQEKVATSEWKRFYRVGSTTGSVNVYPQIEALTTNNESIYIWGAQLEELPYATSYIPTNGGVVTRSAETCTKSNLSTDGIFGGKEGTLFLHTTDMAVKLTSLNNLTPFRLYRQSGDAYRFYYEPDFSWVGSNIDLSANGGELKIAFSISETDANVYVNGSLHASYTYVNPMPSNLETWVWNTETKYKERVKDLKIYDKALTDEELSQLTTI
jgi:hypothetical protein